MTPRELIWSPDAIADLQEIADYIARDKPDAARQWAKTLAALGEQAAALPFAGRCVPEFEREELRELIKRGYRVMYRVSESQVEIVAVIEGHRQVSSELLDR